MQIKGFDNREQQLGLYLFFEENGKVCGIRQEEVKLSAPVLSHHLMYRKDDEKLKDVYGKINGIVLDAGNGKRFAVTWDDRDVDVSRMEEYVDLEEDDAQEPQVEEENGLAEDFMEQEEESVQEPQTEEERGPEEGFVLAEEEMNLEDKPVFRSKYGVTKISRQEISRLPRCEWQLANNQFLMHGYNNFRHLMMVENGNVLKIGVNKELNLKVQTAYTYSNDDRFNSLGFEFKK